MIHEKACDPLFDVCDPTAPLPYPDDIDKSRKANKGQDPSENVPYGEDPYSKKQQDLPEKEQDFWVHFYVTWVTYSTLNLVIAGGTLQYYRNQATNLSRNNGYRYSAWTESRVREAAPIKHWLNLGKFKLVMYGIMAALNVGVAVVKDNANLTRWWFEWFLWCGLEPIISLIWTFVAFKSYEDCRDVVAYTASDVMCLDGSNSQYGDNGSVIAGATDSERRVYFWVNLATIIITGGVHGALFEEAVEEHDQEEFEAEDQYEQEREKKKKKKPSMDEVLNNDDDAEDYTPLNRPYKEEIKKQQQEDDMTDDEGEDMSFADIEEPHYLML